MTVTDLKKMLTAGRHAHLIGIGGVSMFPLAELLKVRGLVITGSDAHKSPNVEHLPSMTTIRRSKPPALPVFRSLSGRRRGAPS